MYTIWNSEDIRLIHDQAEIVDVYYERSAPLAHGEMPYTEMRQEYPILGLLYISSPRLFTDSPYVFEKLLTFFNLILLGIVVWMTAVLMRMTKQRLWYLALFFLPATLYFTFNRFDIVIVAIVQLSLIFLFKKKFYWAIAILAIGFFVKWYSVLFIPVYVIYWMSLLSSEEFTFHIKRVIWLVGGIVVIPTIALLFLSGQGSLFPYAYHTQRSIEFGNVLIPYVGQLLEVLPTATHALFIRVISMVLFVGQILLPIVMVASPGMFRSRIRNTHDVIKWMVIVLTLFLLFAKFYSPQFLLWLLPLFILLLRKLSDLVLYIFLDLIHYLSFPILYDQFAWDSVPYAMMALARTLLYAMVLIRVFKGGFIKVPIRSKEETLIS